MGDEKIESSMFPSSQTLITDVSFSRFIEGRVCGWRPHHPALFNSLTPSLDANKPKEDKQRRATGLMSIKFPRLLIV